MSQRTLTCIVGLVDGRTVYIGGDSAGVDDSLEIVTRLDTKVFEANGMLFGFTSSFRMGQILRYSFRPPEQSVGQDEMSYLCGAWTDSLIATMKERGYAIVKDNQVSGGTFVVGFNGRLYVIESDFQVGRIADDYTAVGCGAPYALGSLMSTNGRGIAARDRVLEALEVAEHFSCGVRRPFVVERLDAS